MNSVASLNWRSIFPIVSRTVMSCGHSLTSLERGIARELLLVSDGNGRRSPSNGCTISLKHLTAIKASSSAILLLLYVSIYFNTHWNTSALFANMWMPLVTNGTLLAFLYASRTHCKFVSFRLKYPWAQRQFSQHEAYLKCLELDNILFVIDIHQTVHQWEEQRHHLVRQCSRVLVHWMGKPRDYKTSNRCALMHSENIPERSSSFGPSNPSKLEVIMTRWKVDL